MLPHNQAQELSEINAALESSTEYIQKCEAEIALLEGRITTQPTVVTEASGKAGSGGSTKDTAQRRKSELQHHEQVEALNRQLVDSEKKLEVTHIKRPSD